MSRLRKQFPAVFAWAAALAIFWWIATGPSLDSWQIGLPTVCVAAATAVALGAGVPRVRWSTLPSFLAFILRRSAVGSVDVARRALRSEPAIAPAVFRYPLRSERGHVLLATLVSLLPGTLAARLEEGRMVVHSLGPESEAREEISSLEVRVARLLGDDGAASGNG